MASVNTAPTAEECAAAGEAAQEVVRKYYVQLCNAIPRGDVLGHLYANKLIDQITFERYVEPGTLSTTEKARQVVLDVRSSVARGCDKAARSEITSLCNILRGEKDQELTGLANAIEESYKDEWETRKAAIKAQMADRESKELEKIRLQLTAFKVTSQLQDPPVDNLREITERVIQNFVKISFDTAMNITTIQEQLKELHEENLISFQQLTWALQEVEKTHATQADIPSINPYISVHPLPGKLLGDGPHGKVLLVVDKNGVKHAAKCFQRAHSKEFTSEFGLLALARHKNIVRYIGLARLPSYENPAVVMELMNIDLHKRILQQPSIELSNKFNMLRDIAEGLDYLHTYQPMIIHRDLTAKNVLLSTSGVAKIADFGNSRMVNQEQLTEMSSVAGTLVYLAPEAQGNEYDEKIDIFSYGHLMLFIFIDEFPNDLSSPSYPVLDPNKPNMPVPRIRLETDRRRKYLEKLEKRLRQDTSVIELVEKCLSNIPADHPAASQLVEFHTKHVVYS